MSNKQLYEKENNINKPFFPVIRLEDIIDNISEKSIQWILNNYNHIYVEWKNDVVGTRLSVPTILRRNGLWITYNNGDKLITEYYIGKNTEIKDKHWQDDVNWEDYTNKLIDGSVEYRHLSESLKQLFNKGNITNFPDEEDLTSDGVALSFKDREYDPENFSGLGRVILRKNIVKVGEEYKNIITQSMINKENTIYEIRYDFDLNGQEIAIPEGCVLKFEGGSLMNGKVRGNNTNINSKIIKIFSLDIILKGTWSVSEVYPEWFDAKGDGVSNDTLAIRAACKLSNNMVLFSDKTYIINIESGKTQTEAKSFFENFSAKTFKGCGGSTLKLGNDNGDTRINKGYESIFYCSGDFDFVFDGIIFDFNYKDNPIYQYSGINVGVEQNGQQMAIYAHRVASLTVRNCVFIEHSGTNCIGIRTSDTAEHLYFNVDNCQFLKTGKKSYYSNGGVIYDAYHDCSTIGGHMLSTSKTPFTAKITNNYAESAGGNAFNFCEINADVCIFSNNKIKDYYYGVMPLSGNKLSDYTITDNIIINCAKAINVWNRYEDNIVLEKGDYGFNNLIISNNTVSVDIMNRLKSPSFERTEINEDGYYLAHSYGMANLSRWGFISFATQQYKNIKNFIIDNNFVEFYSIDELQDSYIGLGSFSAIRIPLVPYHANTDSIIDNINITNNTFKNVPSNIWNNVGFNIINYFNFKNNCIINAFCKTTQIVVNDGLIEINSTWNNKIATKYITIIDNVISYNNNLELDYSNGFGSFLNSEEIKDTYLLCRNNKFSKTIAAPLKFKNIYKHSLDFGTSDLRPNLPFKGEEFYDRTINRKIIWDGEKWVDMAGTHLGLKSFGRFEDAPSDAPPGFPYYAQDVRALESNLNGCTIYSNGAGGWRDAKGLPVTGISGNKISGTFNEKPIYVIPGFAYFCTDKQTTEGASNGIMIYYKGDDVWVDALGRIIV